LSPRDDALLGFSSVVVDLIRRTKKQRVNRFAAVSVPADELAALGKYLSDLAKLIKSRSSGARPTKSVQGISNISTDRSPDGTTTEVAQLNAADILASKRRTIEATPAESLQIRSTL
jgi:hypothetical protein